MLSLPSLSNVALTYCWSGLCFSDLTVVQWLPEPTVGAGCSHLWLVPPHFVGSDASCVGFLVAVQKDSVTQLN